MKQEIAYLKADLKIKIIDADQKQAIFDNKFTKLFNDYTNTLVTLKMEYMNYRNYTELELLI